MILQKQSRLKIGLTPKNHLENESWNIIWWKWYIDRVRMKMQLENAWYVCILYIWYSIRVWFGKKRLQKKYFQNYHKCIWFFLEGRVSDSKKKDSRRSISTFKIVKYFWFSWAGRKWFGSFWVKSIFFQIRVYITEKGSKIAILDFQHPEANA